MRRTHVTRGAFALLAIAFFASPLALRAIGFSAESFENRRFAKAPAPSQGWSAFQQATRYLTDRMPLRAQAVRANTRLWLDVFGTDPPYARDTALAQDEALPFAGAVEHDDRDLRIEGRAGAGPAAGVDRGAAPTGGGGEVTGSSMTVTGDGGWLYHVSDFGTFCTSNASNEEALRRWARLVQTIGADGREAALFVAPYKASIYPEHLPDAYPFDECALEGKDRLWRLLSEAGPGRDVIGLRDELLRLKATAGDGLYMRKDTHWSTLGALVLVGAILDAVGDDVQLEPNDIVDRGQIRYTGNLTIVGGDSGSDTTNEYGIRRAPGAARVPGRTLLLCDSFAYRWIHLLKPYFESIRYVAWYDSDRKIAAAIRDSDRVIVETTDWGLLAQSSSNDRVATVVEALTDAGR